MHQKDIKKTLSEHNKQMAMLLVGATTLSVAKGRFITMPGQARSVSGGYVYQVINGGN